MLNIYLEAESKYTLVRVRDRGLAMIISIFMEEKTIAGQILMSFNDAHDWWYVTYCRHSNSHDWAWNPCKLQNKIFLWNSTKLFKLVIIWYFVIWCFIGAHAYTFHVSLRLLWVQSQNQILWFFVLYVIISTASDAHYSMSYIPCYKLLVLYVIYKATVYIVQFDCPYGA